MVKGATSKGRTSSKALSSVLRRVCAGSVAYGLYLVLPFCPTRLNPADDPSRGVPLRSSGGGFGFEDFSFQELQQLASVSGFRRWASNWVRLTARLLGLKLFSISDRSLFPIPWPQPYPQFGLGSAMDFDSTLGFPGEGPWTFHFVILLLGFLHHGICSPFSLMLCCCAAGAGVVAPGR